MPEPVTRTENDAVIEAMERFGGAQTVELANVAGRDGLPVAIETVFVPKGMELKSVKPLLDEYREHPERRRGRAVFTVLDSFIAHANRFKDATSAVFADDTRGQAGFVSVLDYHAPAQLPPVPEADEGDRPVLTSGPAVPGWLQHRGQMTLKPSEPYLAWSKINGTWMSGTDLAEFLEDRILDIYPTPTVADDPLKQQMIAIGGKPGGAADIMALARSFKVVATRENVEVRNLSTGEVEMTYREEHKDEAGQKVNVPTCFVVGIPIFHGEAPYRLLARLRFRAGQGGVKWLVLLHRLDLAEDDAFGHAVARVANETGLPVFIGKPEA